MNPKMTLPPWVQMALHFLFLLTAGANASDLIPAGVIGKWVMLLLTTSQTFLALHGLYTPVPTNRMPSTQEQPRTDR